MRPRMAHLEFVPVKPVARIGFRSTRLHELLSVLEITMCARATAGWGSSCRPVEAGLRDLARTATSMPTIGDPRTTDARVGALEGRRRDARHADNEAEPLSSRGFHATQSEGGIRGDSYGSAGVARPQCGGGPWRDGATPHRTTGGEREATAARGGDRRDGEPRGASGTGRGRAGQGRARAKEDPPLRRRLPGEPLLRQPVRPLGAGETVRRTVCEVG